MGKEPVFYYATIPQHTLLKEAQSEKSVLLYEPWHNVEYRRVIEDGVAYAEFLPFKNIGSIFLRPRCRESELVNKRSRTLAEEPYEATRFLFAEWTPPWQFRYRLRVCKHPVRTVLRAYPVGKPELAQELELYTTHERHPADIYLDAKASLEHFQYFPKRTDYALYCEIESFREDSGASLGKQTLPWFSVSLPEDVVPRIMKNTLRPYNERIPSGEQSEKCFDKISRLDFDFTAEGTLGATIRSGKVSINAVEYSTLQGRSEPLHKKAGESELEAVVHVVDSRGREAEYREKIPFYDYSFPYLKDIRIERCLADGTANPDGTYLKALAESYVAEGFTKQIRIYEEETQAGENGGVYGTFDIDRAHNLRIVISDGCYQASYDRYLETAACIMNAKPDSIAFGGYAEESKTFEVFWKLGRRLQEKIRALFPEPLPKVRYVNAAGEGSGTPSENLYLQYFHPVSQVWEWLNLPDAAGVEYRTIERVQGKPVYARYYDFGDLPKKASKTIPHGIVGIQNVVRTEFYMHADTNGAHSDFHAQTRLPRIMGGAHNIFVDVNKVNIWIITSYAWQNGIGARGRVYYTKAGD